MRSSKESSRRSGTIFCHIPATSAKLSNYHASDGVYVTDNHTLRDEAAMATPLLPGDPRQLGSYWLARRLGAGGQGVVYEGYDSAGGRVAVKALRGAVITAYHRDQLRREVAALGRVAPYCTARIIEVNLDHVPPYLVSEYVPGPDLHNGIRQHGPCDDGELTRLAIGIATALCSIHRAGVTHRDLKPANVLLGPDGPRVIDFGIARTEEMSSSTTGLIKGTLPWMAPELFQGQSVSPAVDVWAWGAIVLFAATGTPPFAGEWPQIAHHILNHHPDTSVLDEPLRHLVERALAKDPADRPKVEDLLLGLVGVADLATAEKEAAAGQATAAQSRGEPAEEVFARLGTSAQEAVPRMFLRLVAPGEHAEDSLRSARGTDFADGQTSEQDIEQVLRAFTEAEILTWQDDLVMLSSAALIRAWPRLREWVEAEREGLSVHQGFAGASRLWDDHGRKNSDLFQGTALTRAQSWTATARRLTLNHTEQAFLHACAALARRRGRLRALLSAVLAILLLLAGTTAAIAVVQGRSLQDRNLTISRQLEQAVGTRVAGLATTMRRADPLTAKRLAVAAASLAPGSHEARHALLTLYNQAEQYTYGPPGVEGWRSDGDGTGHLRVYARGNEVKVADVDARTVIRSFTFPGKPLDTRLLAGPSLSGDGKVLALLQQDRTITLFDTATGRPRPVTFRAPTVFFGLDTTGERLLISEEAGTGLWDTSSGKRLVKIPYLLASAEITPDGRYLITPRETSLDFWDLRTGRKARTLRLVTGTEEISRITLSPDGRLLALRQGKRLGVVPFARLDPSEVRWRTIRQSARNEGIIFSANSRYVSFKGTIWDTKDISVWGDAGGYDDQPIFTYANTECFQYVFGPGDRTLRCVEDADLSAVVVVSLAAVLGPVPLHPDGYGISAALSDDGSTLAVGDHNSVAIWDPITMARRNTLPISWQPGAGQPLSRDGRLLAVITGNGGIDIWDVVSATRRTTLATRHQLSDSPFAFSPDGRTLAVLTKDDTGKEASLLELWDVASGTRRAAVSGRPAAGQFEPFGIYTAVYRILFSRDGRTVVSAPDQGVIETATGKRLVPPNPGVSQPMTLSANGLLANNHYHGRLTLWDGRSLQRVGTATIGGAPAAFSPDGHLLAVADGSNQVRLWDVTTSRPLGLPLAGFFHPKDSLGVSSLKSLGFAPDGSAVLAIDSRGRLRTHLIAPDKIKTVLCAQAGPLSEADWKRHIPELPYRKTC
ncbi:protein kinase [Streptosporangium sp. NPDC006013]|uniref:WD40 repeat domain-containing serine/threonine protein kinase n=1 Tax=Streptosporangium sp. NPDC006013 TaxID=3155596 RepID=UPI0033AF7F3F